jgi:hypothetical protein
MYAEYRGYTMAELDLNNLVINNIDVDAITNVGATGVFDKLMASVNSNIQLQYEEGRITNNDYANVYLGSLQAVLQQSIQFVLQEQVSEVQISNMLKDNELKDEQIKAVYTDRLLKDKQAAKLGLDNVMKNSELSKNSDANYVYTPKYVAGIE